MDRQILSVPVILYIAIIAPVWEIYSSLQDMNAVPTVGMVWCLLTGLLRAVAWLMPVITPTYLVTPLLSQMPTK